ncbi:8905_t:CDS:2 [Entrophospora sp. SA101]|nr:11371_t:CDS:2 [Entrophospora sp. SA101]CAJ0908131.1 8905_t:CDS:2 [Entrophospora sp. SA101]
MSSSSSRRHITRSTNPIHGRSHREPSSASHSNNTPDEQISDDSVIESDDESMGTVEGYNSKEEIALKKSEIARKRKHQSIQRAEQDKMDTINRLLKKQATRKRKADQDENDSASNTTASATLTLPSNSIHYVKSVDGSTLSIPIGVEIPIKFEKGPKYPPPIPSCSLSGCDKPKKYRNVKKFEEFACSMEHLKLLSS